MADPKVPFVRADYLSAQELLKRGWTYHLIDRHLVNPDKLCIDPVSKGGRRRSLYLRGRVEVAEAAEGMAERLALQREKQEAEAQAKRAKQAAKLAAEEAAEAAIVAGQPKITVPLDPKRAAAVLLQHLTAREVRALVMALRSQSSGR